MKRSLLIAMAVTPIVAAGAGVAIARFTSAEADEVGGRCAEPTVMIDIADGAALVTGGPNSTASCDANSCSVVGAEQVEVQADGRVQCVNVDQGQVLALTRRATGLSLVVTETGR
jgi:hypothetical protein